MTAPAYHERGFCVAERRDTAWSLVGQEGEGATRGLYWRCRSCDRWRLALADVPDALQLCETVRAEWERQYGITSSTLTRDGWGRYDRDDFRDHLRLELWRAYLDWDGRGTFLGFGTSRIRQRAVSYFRKNRGEEGHRKAHADAASLEQLVEGGAAADASDRLDTLVGRRVVDGGADRASPLAEELTRRRRRIALVEARQARQPRLGREEDARAAG